MYAHYNEFEYNIILSLQFNGYNLQFKTWISCNTRICNDRVSLNR